MPFKTIKTGNSKSRKIEIFSKGLVHGLGQKLVIFPSFYLRQNRTEKCDPRYFENKTTLFYIREICIFPKGLVHSFGPKLPIFPSFYFRQKSPEKCVLKYSRKKKRPSRL